MAMRALIQAVLATVAAGLCGDDTACQLEMAAKFAPEMRLDKNTLSRDRCLPGHPADVYWQRKAGHTDVICESDVSKLENGEVPTFYHYEECAGDEVVAIDYFVWYSHQKECLKLGFDAVKSEIFGDHPGDWETVAVQIVHGEVRKVRFHQHSGSYSLPPKSVEFVGDTHPVAYVGLDSHGSYHDQGGTGNCLYFQDYRRFEDDRLKLEGWRFLLDTKNRSENMPEWHNGNRAYLDGFPTPSEKGFGCGYQSCKGTDSWVAATGICTGKACGCRKSEWCDDIPFGNVTEEKPCEQSLANDVSEKVKDLLFGKSAQVSSAQPVGFAAALGVAMFAM
ncbi:unnamed protein product [Effrenium voratum]|uniref:Uncharacterized protein n=1 Tax=Effrenium voratum TaxID=2562239 RepID=A0AA36JCT7_9DINO|nr:unnamed protein product [Effrenium voratum]